MMDPRLRSEANDEVFNHIYGRSIKDDEKLGVE